MSHFLVCAWDGGGTVPPILSLVRALEARGHGVTVLADPTLAGEVEEAGAAFRPWTRAPHRRTADPRDVIVADWEIRTPPKLFAALRDAFLCGPADDFARDVEDALAVCSADALVVDGVLLGAQVAAEASGLPWASVFSNVYPLPAPGLPPFGSGWSPPRTPLGAARERAFAAMSARMWRRGLPPLQAARHARGLEGLAHPLDQPLRADRLLVLSPSDFEFPADLPGHVRHVGPRLDDPAWAGDWDEPPGDDPLVLVAMSSTFMNQAPLLGRVAGALGTLPVRGLVTTGPAIDPSDVPAPPNVRVVARAPHREVMARAAVVVTHGGHGTVMKALAAGVPVVCMPMGRDQPDTAARIVAAGCGVRLPRRASQRRIAAAVARVVREPDHRRAAGAMAAAIAAECDGDPALREIEDLPAGAPRRSSLSPA